VGMFKQLKDMKKAVEAAPGLVDQSMQMADQAQQMAAAQQAAAQQAAAQQAAAQQAATQQAAPGAGGDFEPIAGVSLEQFAEVCKGLAAHGYDQSKGPEVAASKGIGPAEWQQALDGWNARVKANPAVAQRFSAAYHGS
jgi:multidrug efflux pump subunit AcrA (membrane-fusion protein)